MAPHAATATGALVRTRAPHPAALVRTTAAHPAPSTVHGESDPEFALGEWETEVSEEWYGCQGEDGDYEVSHSRLHDFLL
jgi:hypothetical protein